MSYQVPETAMKDEIYSATPYLTNETSSTAFGSRKVWKMVYTGKTWANNDGDGKLFTIPDFYKLVDIRGIVVLSSSGTRVPIPLAYGGDYIYPRVTDSGEVWLRQAGTNFNNVDIFFFVKFMKK